MEGTTSNGGWNDGTKFDLVVTSEVCNPVYPNAGHPGTLNISMGDASVRSLPQNTAALVWQYACQPNDGQANVLD